MSKSIMKKFWYDEYSGGFNWALVAVIAFVGIFLFNVITAEVILPDETGTSHIEEKAEPGDAELNSAKDNESTIKLPAQENKLKI